MTKLMEIKRALEIVDKYGSVLEKGWGAFPISMLPFSKEEIKSAIQTLLIAQWKTKPWDSKSENALASGYVMLGSFVDDDRARDYIEYEFLMRWAAKLDKDQLVAFTKNDETQRTLSKALEIDTKIAKQTELLKDELDALRKLYCKGSG